MITEQASNVEGHAGSKQALAIFLLNCLIPLGKQEPVSFNVSLLKFWSCSAKLSTSVCNKLLQTAGFSLISY